MVALRWLVRALPAFRTPFIACLYRHCASGSLSSHSLESSVASVSSASALNFGFDLLDRFFPLHRGPEPCWLLPRAAALILRLMRRAGGAAPPDSCCVGRSKYVLSSLDDES